MAYKNYKIRKYLDESYSESLSFIEKLKASREDFSKNYEDIFIKPGKIYLSYLHALEASPLLSEEELKSVKSTVEVYQKLLTSWEIYEIIEGKKAT
jgi:hypothetical protein